MESPHLPGVGTRFSSGLYRGTVRYVGEIQGTEGVWLGVEWDDASRGKHSGVHGNVRYFTCRIENSGSFIRASSKLSFGSSFLQALKAKYVADTTLMTLNREPKQYGRRNLADIEVETPNMAGVIQRSSRLHKLREVGLGGWKREMDPEGKASESDRQIEVAFAYDSKVGEQEGDISNICLSARGLDLSRSLLPSWLELSRITKELPQLENLLLHFNRFAPLSPDDMPLSDAFSRLKDLRIDGTLISWREALLLANDLPNLEVLQMGSNGLPSLDGSQTSLTTRFEKLRILNLDENDLCSWNDVWSSMKACPKLERLILSSNEFTNISVEKREDEHSGLQHLSLWNNPISCWSDLDALDASVGGLKSLVLGGDRCNLTKNLSMQDVRLITIARLALLQSFNNAPVQAIERREAELYYLSLVAKETLSEEKPEKLHPRWMHLTQIHGAPVKDDGSNNKSKGTLRSKLLTIKVCLSLQPPSSQAPHVNPVSDSSKTQQIELSLLMTTPLRLLKSKLARSFALKKGPRSIQSIWALLSPTIDPTQSTAQLLRSEMRPEEAQTNERIVYEMDNLERDLQGYNFFNGDEIVLVISDL